MGDATHCTVAFIIHGGGGRAYTGREGGQAATEKESDCGLPRFRSSTGGPAATDTSVAFLLSSSSSGVLGPSSASAPSSGSQSSSSSSSSSGMGSSNSNSSCSSSSCSRSSSASASCSSASSKMV